MAWIRPLAELSGSDAATHGGKAGALGELCSLGLPVPPGVGVSVQAYRTYVQGTGLATVIALELGRKRFADMRWEELWDAAQRIRSRFLRATWPEPLRSELHQALEAAFDRRPVVVRSSAPGEDAGERSFAGLHDSYVNLRGAADVLEHLRLVWSSLWSDRALLYRQELGLDVVESAMAVVVQELIIGERSGVCFTRGPMDDDETVVEAVWGLNEGLVDGTVAPDRWHLSRTTGTLRHQAPSERSHAVQPGGVGTRRQPLGEEQRRLPPLTDDEVRTVVGLARRVETHRGSPQDVELTLAGDQPWLLQARPITAREPSAEEDQRAWYLSLHRSFDQLVALRRRIEDEVLPGMTAAAEALEQDELDDLSTDELSAAIRLRRATRERWVKAYWQDCIPFAHGIRLFGQVVNQRLRPADPFAFVELLRAGDLLAVERNRRLEQLARAWATARQQAGDALDVEQLPAPLDREVEAFLREFGPGMGAAEGAAVDRRALAKLLGRWSAPQGAPPGQAGAAQPLTKEQYFGDASGDERAFLEELLDLGRASYRLRDDDNLYLGRIEAELQRALVAGGLRPADRAATLGLVDQVSLVLQRLEDPAAVEVERPSGPAPRTPRAEFRARQLVGQPASSGFATGRARVIDQPSQLFEVERGEVLVCDAVSPTMTFVAPLCAAIVERRGGMLIHGAIIAREYGVPAVTGVPDATDWIRTGDQLAVDGTVGLVTVTPRADRAVEPYGSGG